MMAPCQEKTFYWYFKPIAVTCKCMGIFPLQNILSNDPKDLKVKMKSLAYLYSSGIFAANIYMIWYFSGFIFNVKEYFYLFIVVDVILVRTTLCFLYCGSQSRKLPKLIRLLDAFDKKKTSVLTDKTDTTLRDFVLWTALPIILGFTCICMSFFESMNILLETMPPELSAQNTTSAAVFFGTLCVWQVVPLLLYMYFASKIIGNFNIINRTLRKRGYVANFFDDNVKYPEDMHVSLEYLRHMHNMTTKSVYELGKCYGDFMAVDQLCVIVMVITNVCTFINTRSHDIHLIAFTIINVFIVLCVLLISHRIKESVSSEDFFSTNLLLKSHLSGQQSGRSVARNCFFTDQRQESHRGNLKNLIMTCNICL
jgi:hypothetical protein